MLKRRFFSNVIYIVITLIMALSMSIEIANASEIGVVTGDNLNVRSTPTLQGQVLGKLFNGNQVDIIDQTGEWLRVQSPFGEGYIHSDFVKVGQANTDQISTIKSPAVSSSAVKVYVNDELLQLPIEPPIVDNRVLVPFRGIGETLGINVNWIAETRQVEAISHDKQVLFTIGSNKVQVNNDIVKLDTAPTIVGSSTVLPLRFFAESYGADVNWDPSNRVVNIGKPIDNVIIDHPVLTSPNETPEPPVISKKTYEALVDDDHISVYEEPSKKSDKLGTVDSGDVIKVYEFSQGDSFDRDKWLEINYENEIGYIALDSIRPVKDTIKGTVNSSTLNIRESADVNSPMIGSLVKGETILVYEFDGNWARIKHRGNWGYIHTNYITMKKGNVSYAALIEPKLDYSSDRSVLEWSARGAVNTSHRLLPNGVEITANATNIDQWNESHPAIRQIEYNESASGSKISIYLNSGYHFVIEHSTDSVKVRLLNSGVAGKKIVIDPGHGDHDPGAVGVTGLKEKEVNISVAHKLASLLQDAGAEITMTRRDDTFLSLAERVQVAKQSGADSFISIHSDSFKATTEGSTTFYHSGKNPSWQQSKQLSDIAIKKLTSQLGTKSRGSNDKSLHVIRENDMPAILIEVAFLSNPNEEKRLKSEEFRQKAAQAMYDSFVEFYE